MLRTDISTVEKILNSLIEEYKSKDVVMEVRKVGPYYSMNLRTEYIPLLKKYVRIRELTKAEARLLAIIHKQPGIKKSLLSKKIGSKVYDQLADLVKRGFIREVKEGRTSLLYTTDKYADYSKKYH